MARLRIPIILLLGSVFVFSYLNQLLYRYQVPPGGDAFNHLEIVNQILAGNYQWIWQYHSLWHLLVIAVSKLTGVTAITVMAWLGPGLLVGSSFVLFYLNYRYFGLIAGLVSAAIIGFFSWQPLQTLYDGGFPNVLSAGIVLPLTIIALENTLTTQGRLKHLLILLVFLILLLMSHHITTAYGLLTIIVFLFVYLWKRLERAGVNKVLLLFIPPIVYTLFLVGLGSFLNFAAANSTRGLIAQFMKVDPTFPYLHFIGRLDNPDAYLSLAELPQAVGWAPVFLGLFGFVLAIIYFLTSNDLGKRRISLVLLIWTTILLVGSQLPALGFPVRLMRDLGVPLALLGGIFVGSVVEYITARTLPKFLAPLVILLSLATGWAVIGERLARAAAPNPLVYHLKVDHQAASKITSSLPENSKIALFYDDIYLGRFTPKHQLINLIGSLSAKSLVNPATANQAAASFDYIYLERRLDRPDSWNNNNAIIAAYKQAKNMVLIFQFEQPEKQVYLYKMIESARMPVQKSKTKIKP